MSASAYDYYSYLTRTDHPVFNKVFNETVDDSTPLNSIMNWVVANQLVKIKAMIDDLRANSFPNTVTLTWIDQWEETYFGYTKPSLDLADRIIQLVEQYNQELTMSVNTVLALAESITGQTPRIVRSLLKGGWTLGQSVLGLDTVIAGNDPENDSQIYLVIFDQVVPSALLAELDEQLTIVQKGGSTFHILAVAQKWVLGQSALGQDTVLG